MAWEVKKLGDVCEIVNGGTPDTTVKSYWDGEHLWITPRDMGKLNNLFVDETERKITDSGLKNSSAKLLPINSIILSSRAPIGHLAINKKPMSTNQGCKGIIPKKTLDFMFLYYFLKSSVDLLNSLGSGTTFKELSGSKLGDVSIPIPPLLEQKRIVAILDKAFESIAKTKENSEKNLENAKEIFESYLQSVFENKGEGWEEKTLMEVSDQITDGSHFSPESSTEDEYPYITVRDIEEDIINFEKCKFINKVSYQALLKNGCKPNFGDLLFSKDGTVGKVSLVDFEKDFVVLSSLAIIRPKRNIIDSYLLKYILKNPQFLKIAVGKKTGAAIRRIILKNLKMIKIVYPKSIAEQQLIVKKLNKLSHETKQLSSIYEKKLLDLEELKKSILQKAFKGELTKVLV